ncbi:MAG: hypothetical protein ACE5E5_10615 [Phycisphaerae bacterium]
MKNGTAYAAKLSKAWNRFKGTVKTPEIPELADPLRCLAIGILGVATTENKAEKAVDRILATMVDWNEVRVSNAAQIAEVIGGLVPKPLGSCQRLIDALQDIYDRENRISLDRLRTIGRREARQFLEELAGTDEYAVACAVLWGLGGHAIPANDRLLAALRDADLVHPAATRAEVQAFMERHISASEGKVFSLKMRSFAASKRSEGSRKSQARKKV